MSIRIYAEDIESGEEESIDNYRDLFIPLTKEKPSLEDALDQLYLSVNVKNAEIKRNKVIEECKKNLEKKFEKIQKIHPNITKNEALIIFTYTYEDDSKQELTPYKILNKILLSNDKKNGLQKICKYFFILLKALRHLTPFNSKNQILYKTLEK